MNNLKGRTWRRLSGFQEWLEFSRKDIAGASFDATNTPQELRSGYSVDGKQVEFTDGTALVIFSGVEYGSSCPTCGDGDTPVCYYYALEES